MLDYIEDEEDEDWNFFIKKLNKYYTNKMGISKGIIDEYTHYIK